MVTQTATRPTRTIPGIAELPLVGSLWAFQRDRMGLFLRIARECGDIGRLHFASFPAVLITSSELTQKFLVEHAYDFYKGEAMHRAFEPIIGHGLFISEGDFHRRQRKLMAPSFQPRHIVSYADAMVHYGELAQKDWQDGETIDIGREMTHITMSIVGKVLFDADVFTESDELGNAITVVLEQTNYTLSHLFPVPPNWPVPRNRRVKRALAVLDRRIHEMVVERQASATEKNDLLSVLLNAREEDGSTMSDKQVRDEALTLFAAGHETTATALTWVWYLLAAHPDVYQKVQQEVDTVLQGRAPTYTDLARLPYALQVLKEAMRLYPPAYAVSSVALHDVHLGDYLLRKDETVIVGIHAMHQRADYFPDPERFDPERFTPDNEKRLPRYAYIPFGAGPRICIGNHFAMMEGHLLLATLAQRVSFELVSGQQIEPDPSKTITTRPKYPMKMIVRRRSE